MMTKLERYLGERGAWAEAEIKRQLKGGLAGRGAAIAFLEPAPALLRRAMGYSLLAGGKRLRPVLVMAAAECCGLAPRRVIKAACALEMIHTYSLIHDDLPAMDDDDLRRGRPTSHKVFGEAVAILAGDGLLTWAFELAAENAADLGLSGKGASELIRVIAAGAGARGMVGGQTADISAEGWPDSKLRDGRAKKALGLIRYIHAHKTAALITASLEAGAVLAQTSASRRGALREYGYRVGVAFQVADDVLDVVGDKKKLGKRGSDADNLKLTYPRLYGIEPSERIARGLADRAKKALSCFGPAADPLRELADYVVTRDR
ncbi:MAG: polyprenyl synthetase family protein [Elusimicrobia bacterium]|nr:polyprenyl synthetase family protein [Elusimicrobiota bacterium]